MEKLLPLEKVKKHLRIDDDYEDDNVALYRDAAIHRAERFINGRFVSDASAISQAGDIPMNPAIAAACLIAAAWLYQNREGGALTQNDEMPAGFYALLLPYRLDLGVM